MAVDTVDAVSPLVDRSKNGHGHGHGRGHGNVDEMHMEWHGNLC